MTSTKRVLACLLLITTTVVLAEAPAQAAPVRGGKHGMQLGQVVDINTCARNGQVNTFLDDFNLLARTSWLRLDLRGAGGGNGLCPTATLAHEYQAIVDELAARAPHIEVIGLMSHEFIYGGSDWDGGPYLHLYSDAALEVACYAPEYADIDIWEVWNEPDLPDTFLPAQAYAQILGTVANDLSALSLIHI